MNTRKVLREVAPAALAAAVLVMAAPQGQAAESGVETGLLTCQNVPGSGINLLIHSVTNVNCTFKSTDGKVQQKYKGEAGIGLGVDLKWKREENVTYTVISAAKDISADNYFLAGKYAGARANVTLVVGGGAQVLVGGLEKSITLQPVALETSKGFGVAGGLGYLYLEPDK